MAAEGGADHGVVVVGELGPFPSTDPSLVVGRGHDVGEEDPHRQHVALGPTPRTGQELLDLVCQGVRVTHEEQVVVTRENDELGIGDVLGHVPSAPQMDDTVSFTVEHQSGTRDRGEKANVSFVGGPDEVGHPIRATGESCRAGKPGSEALTGHPAWGDDLQRRTRAPAFFDGGHEPTKARGRKAPG
jgi:hypothetical protein